GATGYGSPVYEALGEAAFHERRKIHDLIMEGIDAILKKRQVWGGAVGAVGDLISGVVGKTPWAPAPHARRLTERYGIFGRDRADHCQLMPADLITLAHLSVSSAMSLPKSAGEPASTVPPRSASRAFALGSASISLISRLSLSMTSLGVLWRAHTVPRADLVAWNKLAYGRKLRHCLRAHRAGHRKSAELAGSDVLDRRR